MEASAPQAVVSVPPCEEFTEPEYNQVHQEQTVTGEMTLNSVEHPAAQEQAAQVVGSLPVLLWRLLRHRPFFSVPPFEDFTGPEYNIKFIRNRSLQGR